MLTLTYTQPITALAHTAGDRLSKLQKTNPRAKQTYLNTLARYAVADFLNAQNIATDLINTQAEHPVISLLHDVADIYLPELDLSLECRFVTDGDRPDILALPPEIQEFKQAYVVVQLNHALDQAQLLGFYPVANPAEPTAAIALTQLQPIEEFGEYLLALMLDPLRTFLSSEEPAVKAIGDRLSHLSTENFRQHLEDIFKLDSIEQPFALGELFEILAKQERELVTHRELSLDVDWELLAENLLDRYQDYLEELDY